MHVKAKLQSWRPTRPHTGTCLVGGPHLAVLKVPSSSPHRSAAPSIDKRRFLPVETWFPPQSVPASGRRPQLRLESQNLSPKAEAAVAICRGKLGQGDRLAQRGQVHIDKPVVHSFEPGSALHIVGFLAQFLFHSERSAQPVQGLTAQPTPLLVVQLEGVLSFRCCGQAGGASAVVKLLALELAGDGEFFQPKANSQTPKKSFGFAGGGSPRMMSANMPSNSTRRALSFSQLSEG